MTDLITENTNPENVYIVQIDMHHYYNWNLTQLETSTYNSEVDEIAGLLRKYSEALERLAEM